MFEWITDEEERGQVGIGTLIVFIAMVLVAAIAAGVLINTAGFLQTKSEATGEEASAQVSNRVTVVSAHGNVTDETGSNTVDYVNLTVMRASGSDNINLSEATIQWLGPDHARTLTYSPKDGSNEYKLNETLFGTEHVKGGAGDAQVLVDQSDRIMITMWAGNSTGGITNGLEPGDDVKLQITTQYGSQTPYYVTVPESLEGKQTVQL